jgi:dUTP pyrophosphatase
MSKISEFKDTMKMLKELQSNLGNMKDINIDNPHKILESLGVDVDVVEKTFKESFNKKLEVKYVYKSVNKEPKYEYLTDSGFDLRSNIKVTLKSLERALVPTGLYVDVPSRHELQVRPKSGLALNKGLSVLNTPGTVDYGYTGEIKVIVINLSAEEQTIEVGDKIAQAVICPVVQGGEVELVRVMEIEEKDRNSNGFGSTGN